MDQEGDDDGEAAPSRPASPAFNRLAPVLSMLARTSKLTLQEISERTGCSASYLSRIVNGERVPSWRITERYASACGADPAVLRKVWETERLQDKSPRDADHQAGPDLVLPAPAAPGEAAAQLRRALHTLHVRAGQPSEYDMAVATRWKLTANEITQIFDGRRVPSWSSLSRLLSVLGGMHDYFKPLWQAALQESDVEVPSAQRTDKQSAEDQEDELEAATPRISNDGVSRLLSQFSGVLRSGPRLSPAQTVRVRRTIAQRINVPFPADPAHARGF
ncbi:helix-turn-helix transcriptional regulator [Streptomyces sp. NPDC005507]|uniref:helix-turn-helix domain-containing protein n=1 Tax=Streptomyces sp. NPDC005507 TaxID=3154885 RepID=UPI00339FCA6E